MPSGKGKPLSQIGSMLQTGGGIASMVPGLNFLGPVIGGIGTGLSVLDAILGRDKFDWNNWKGKQLGEIDTIYDKSIKDTTATAFHNTDASIGDTANRIGMAGGIAGINNPAKLSANQYSQFMQSRDTNVNNITSAFNQQRSGAKQQVVDRAAQGEYNEEANAPSWRDYASNIMNTLTTQPGQEFLGATAAGIGKAGNFIGNLFKGKGSPIPNTGYGMDKFAGNNTTATNINATSPSGFNFNPEVSTSNEGIGLNIPFGFGNNNQQQQQLSNGQVSMGKNLPLFNFMQSNMWGRRNSMLPQSKPLRKQYVY